MRKHSDKTLRASGTIRVGIAGWKYAPWRGTFYPQELTQKRELEFASRALPTIEINSTFYRRQQPHTYARWYEETPSEFVFSLKAPRVITHERRLREIEKPLASFFASGLFNLKEKLGPILWQFPPTFHFDAALFEDFLALLPHDTKAAEGFAAQHGEHASHTEPNRRLRHVVEIRNESFVDPAFIEMLRRYSAALVVADTTGKWPEFEDACTDLMYLRLHGDAELYASGYSEDALNRWAKRIRAWASGAQPEDARLIAKDIAEKHTKRDVFCYFDNTVKVKAPSNAHHLLEKLGLGREAFILTPS